ncbi:MAG: amino acid adenylation domain-containing protein, partial [Bacteroidota bacterium]|nr:amino acid adenylation domain-containing protein [Bacteroidota bacterium]
MIFNDISVTYDELNNRANHIAHFLIGKGIKPESLVPICLNSGIALITGIIGILKAGGAYVPIDPAYPEGRIKYILDDCQATIAITTVECSLKFRKLFNGETIEIDDSAIFPPDVIAQNPVVPLTPENLAYLIYTSGTTGNPNGVMIEHRSLSNNLFWAKKYFKTASHDIVLQKTTFCFDVSVWEILWPLMCGSKLVILNSDEYKDVETLRKIIELHHITSVHFVPAMLEFFLLGIQAGECKSLKRIICSGEALTTFQANLVRRKIPGAHLYNLYGPTEATIHSTYWAAPHGSQEIDKVLIGKPIDNTEIFIVNEQDELQPVGGIGEIYIGGEGLARG